MRVALRGRASLRSEAPGLQRRLDRAPDVPPVDSGPVATPAAVNELAPPVAGEEGVPARACVEDVTAATTHQPVTPGASPEAIGPWPPTEPVVATPADEAVGTAALSRRDDDADVLGREPLRAGAQRGYAQCRGRAGKQPSPRNAVYVHISDIRMTFDQRGEAP